MSRFNLPDINFIEKDPEAIERDMLFHIEEKTGRTFSVADPARKFLQGLVAYVVQERNNLDYSIKQNLLAYAEDEFLDHHGEDVLTPRLGEKSAFTIMQFILEEDRVSELVVEAGTLFLVGENTFFETEETIVVPVGQHSFDIKAICTEAGEVGNGYLPGEISSLVNPLPWVREVKNVTTSTGGVELEEDEPYAQRIRIAPESFSVAGPEGAYEYWAKTTSQEIVDVIVDSPNEGEIDIRVLLKDGELPSEEMLNNVLNVCSAKHIRPLTDKVSANAPEVVIYEALVQYWVLNSSAAVLSAVQEKINAAYQDYLKWQKEKMGRDVDLTELIVRLKEAGAHRVSIDSPIYLKIERHQVAKEGNTTLTFGGLTDA